MPLVNVISDINITKESLNKAFLQDVDNDTVLEALYKIAPTVLKAPRGAELIELKGELCWGEYELADYHKNEYEYVKIKSLSDSDIEYIKALSTLKKFLK